MLKPVKSKLFESVCTIYARGLFRRRFTSLHVRGAECLQPKDDRAVIIVANHSSWWDGPTAFMLSRHLGLDSFFLMNERHLRSRAPFRLLGGFGIDIANPVRAMRELNSAAVDIAARPRPCIWIFPQGDVKAANASPLGFKPGAFAFAEAMARPTRFVCAAFRFAFAGEYKPHAAAALSNLEIDETQFRGSARRASGLVAESEVRRLLDSIDSDFEAGDFSEYTSVV